ncbi:MAG: hypothetical protein R3C99_22760 [Pirellulaceae bacterium]
MDDPVFTFVAGVNVVRFSRREVSRDLNATWSRHVDERSARELWMLLQVGGNALCAEVDIDSIRLVSERKPGSVANRLLRHQPRDNVSDLLRGHQLVEACRHWRKLRPNPLFNVGLQNRCGFAFRVNQLERPTGFFEYGSAERLALHVMICCCAKPSMTAAGV